MQDGPLWGLSGMGIVQGTISNGGIVWGRIFLGSCCLVSFQETFHTSVLFSFLGFVPQNIHSYLYNDDSENNKATEVAYK